ncbi:uncharacterized protein LOC131455885 [Solea solea]|uniref:uncharacterized protein LOC131455885 n=1 Tax=Solea solea TaxID=90069 RepID=UPI002729ECB3|nr:uncharacterized protein LOC131455885 [Solea solea]
MPRLKCHNCSSVAKKRMEKHLAAVVESAPRGSTSFVPLAPGPSRRGTGRRHRVSTWPVSTLTGRSHKVVIPAESPDKKFVFLVGDSHLRGIVDGIVEFPDEFLSFGAMSTLGACARELTIELLQWTSSSSSSVPCLGGRRLLQKICYNVDLDLQELFRQEFHRVATRMHISILTTGTTPKVERCTSCCKQFHCPLFLKVKPTKLSKLQSHLEAHTKGGILFKDQCGGQSGGSL